jgi:hypothetical protein
MVQGQMPPSANRFLTGLLTGIALSAIVANIRGKGSRKVFVLDRANLPEAISHVVYEYSNLVHSGEYVANKSRGGPIGVHIGDVFLVNCRKFADFFSTDPNYHGDVRAAHFCSTDPLPKVRLPHHRQWRNAINQNLAHISYDRVRRPIVIYNGGNTTVVLLFDELRNAFRLFLKHVDNEHRDAFQAKLQERSITVGVSLP